MNFDIIHPHFLPDPFLAPQSPPNVTPSIAFK